MAQQVKFERYYDFGFAEAGNCVQQTNDGGYIVAGRQGITIGLTKILLFKTDSLGQLQWTKYFTGSNSSGSNESEAYSVKQTSDGGYILTGQTTGLTYPGDYDIYVIKTNDIGDTLWTKRFGGRDTAYNDDYGYSVQQTLDGGYIVGGGITKSDTTTAAYLLKLNTNGDSLWSKIFVGSYKAAASSVQQTPSDSGYILAGATGAYGSNAKGKMYLVKTDQFGDTLWTKIIGPTLLRSEAYSVQQAFDGGYFLTGHVCCADIGYVSDVYIVKTDSYGDTLWTRQIGGSGDDWGFYGEQILDEGYIVTGATQSFDSAEIYLIKLDNIGDTMWTKTFGSNEDAGYFVTQTTDRGFILTGIHGPSIDAFLIKTDSIGRIIIGINDPTLNKNQLSVYPNPFSDAAIVSLPEKIYNEHGIEFTISDILGRELGRRKIDRRERTFKLERDNLPAGLYVIQLISGSELISSFKIIIQ